MLPKGLKTIKFEFEWASLLRKDKTINGLIMLESLLKDFGVWIYKYLES